MILDVGPWGTGRRSRGQNRVGLGADLEKGVDFVSLQAMISQVMKPVLYRLG